MSRATNFIFMTCDRCQHSEYYASNMVAENVGWELDVKIDGGVFDLCPKCSIEWGDTVGNFLYRKKGEDKNSIAISKALDIAYSHGQTDGAHHKAWVILRRCD